MTLKRYVPVADMPSDVALALARIKTAFDPIGVCIYRQVTDSRALFIEDVELVEKYVKEMK